MDQRFLFSTALDFNLDHDVQSVRGMNTENFSKLKNIQSGVPITKVSTFFFHDFKTQGYFCS